MVSPAEIASYWQAVQPFFKAASLAFGLTFWKGVQIVYNAWRQKRQDAEDDQRRKDMETEAEQVEINRRLIDGRLQAENDRLTAKVQFLEAANQDFHADNVGLYRHVLELRQEVIECRKREGLPPPVFQSLEDMIRGWKDDG